MELVDKFAGSVRASWNGELSFPELIDYAARLEASGSAELSAVLYQTWISRTVSPYTHAANFNLGVTLSNLNDLQGSESAYRRAIAAAPQFVQPRLNLGGLLERTGRIDEALVEWEWVVNNCPRDEASKTLVQMALNHLGRVLEVKRQYFEAVQYLTQSLVLQPDQPDVLHHLIFLRQKQCAWPIYEEIKGVSFDAMREATSALAMLSMTDKPETQLHAAQVFVKTKLAKDLPKLTNGLRYGHKKIRLAYCSGDFCLHPVSMLTVQMFESHDRNAFEVFGFCWSPEDGSSLRARVKASMDHFVMIHTLSDEAAARLIMDHEIDILIDLQGQTSGARPNILAHRPAPIQVTYLGLPATTGFPFIDYVIADEFLIPVQEAPHYSEKPIYMPHVYQVSDRKRISSAKPTRSSCGLPEEGFVFCSFNNCYKYTPEVFSVWLSLLQEVSGSVLWLLSDNPSVEKNLRKCAENVGLSPDRLVFASRVSPEDYLSRYLVADLFLDTYPFNAGTTANDCLWMGCPLVTLTGRAFASRMAGAMLTAAGLPELITYNIHDYESLALRLAREPDQCTQIRHKLQMVREQGALFDTENFVKDLELRFKKLVQELPL